jgi:hypothetical protein
MVTPFVSNVMSAHWLAGRDLLIASPKRISEQYLWLSQANDQLQRANQVKVKAGGDSGTSPECQQLAGLTLR